MKWIHSLGALALTLTVLPATPCAAAARPDPLVSELVKDNNAFAIDLYAHLRSRPENAGNLFFSPASISTALAMTLAGARGETATEMRRALHLSLASPRVNEAYAHLLGDWLAPVHPRIPADPERKREPSTPDLAIANRIWLQTALHLHPEFEATMRNAYRAPVVQLDFADDSEGARRAINRAVEEQTRGKIEELLKRGMITPETSLVLTNALYFKGAWDKAFDPKLTNDEPFFTDATHSHLVPMMHHSTPHEYAEVDGAQVLELDYASLDPDKRFSLVLVLPNDRDGLARLESRLDAETLSSWMGKLERRDVDVSLPRFQIRKDFELIPTLEAMGMKRAFTSGADFSGIAGGSLSISHVVHGAFVGVDEKGTEAAAATAVVISKGMAPKFRVDHPCLLILRDQRTGSILFMGRLADPSPRS